MFNKTQVRCKECDTTTDITAEAPDRFCSKCGKPLFLPLKEINEQSDWVDIYNSLYNSDSLFPTTLHYMCNRYANWLYGVNNMNTTLRRESFRNTRMVSLGISFLRAGYTLRVVEEKKFGRAQNEMIFPDIEELRENGYRRASEEGWTLFSKEWDLFLPEETLEMKQKAQELIFKTLALAELGIDTIYIAPKKEIEQYLTAAAYDMTVKLLDEGFTPDYSIHQQIDRRVWEDMIYGYALRVVQEVNRQ